MNPKRRRRLRQISSKQLRRRKNVSFREISAEEEIKIKEQERAARADGWTTIKGEPLDADSLAEVEGWHGIKFNAVFGKLRKRFSGEKLEVLDEGAGRSPLKQELKNRFGEYANVTATDVRAARGWHPDKKVNVMNLVKEFGKNRFHMVVSTQGGAGYSRFPEKALFQIVSVLKPGGIGIVSVNIPDKKYVDVAEDRIAQLAKRFNITIKQRRGDSIVFTKNIGRKKKR